MKLDADAIRALTPIVLTATGGTIALVLIMASIFLPSDKASNLSDGKWASAMGLAGTAIGGAAGLAQSMKNDSESKKQTPTTSGAGQGQPKPQ